MTIRTRIREILREKALKQKVFVTFTTIMIAVSSFLLGSILGKNDTSTYVPLEFVGELNPKVAMLSVEGFEDKSVVLRTFDHSIRILQQDEIYNAPPHTLFTLHLNGTGSLLTAEEPIDLNTPCILIASKTGKIAYKAESTQAARIVHKVCYASEEEALDAGLRLYEN